MKRPFVLLVSALLSSGFGLALVAACTDNGSSSTDVGSLDGSIDARTDRAQLPGEDAAPEVDARADAASICEITRLYTTECNIGSDAGDPLTCGSAKFDEWCALNDKAINSEAFRRAQALCLVKKNCNAFDRKDCEYRSYFTAKQTNAQKQVVQAYCATCEPNNQAGCFTKKTEYDPAKGPNSTDDVFIAAWELNDTLDDAIRTKCTGTALDAGVAASIDAGGDAGPCLKAFGNCAGGIYVDALPNCP